jgi:hypothetical protein
VVDAGEVSAPAAAGHRSDGAGVVAHYVRRFRVRGGSFGTQELFVDLVEVDLDDAVGLTLTVTRQLTVGDHGGVLSGH